MANPSLWLGGVCYISTGLHHSGVVFGISRCWNSSGVHTSALTLPPKCAGLFLLHFGAGDVVSEVLGCCLYMSGMHASCTNQCTEAASRG